MWFKEKKKSYKEEIKVDDVGEYKKKLPFIPSFVEAKFVGENNHQRPSCVPDHGDKVSIEFYFSLVVIKWKTDGARTIVWEAKE